MSGIAGSVSPMGSIGNAFGSLKSRLYAPGFGVFKKDMQKSVEKTHSLGSIEQIYLPHRRMMKACSAIREAEATGYSEIEKTEMAAFSLAGIPYIQNIEESDKYFLDNPDKLSKYMEAYQDIEHVRRKVYAGLPVRGQETIEEGGIVIDWRPEKKKGGKWKKILGGIAIGITLGAAAVGIADYAIKNHDPLVNDLRADFDSDPQVDVNPQETAEHAAAIYRNAGLDYSTMPKVARNLVNNCTFANLKYELPLDSNALASLAVAAENNAEIGDFTPAYVTDFEGNVHSIQSNNIARDSWMIYENLFRDKDVLSRPDWYLAVNMLAQQNGYDFCERYGLDPDSPDAWDVINKLRDHLFDDSRLGYKIALSQLADSNDKKICYMSLFGMPERVADLDDYKSNPRDPMQYTGLRAAKYTVDNLQRLYDEIANEYPDGKSHDMPYDILNNRDYRLFYYSWIADRAVNGLKESSISFLGDIYTGNDGHIDGFLERVNNTDSINSWLGNVWNDYDLIKFVHGYSSAYGSWDNVGEGLYYPITLRAFGIPTMGSWYEQNYGIYPNAIGRDIGFLGVPDDVVQSLKEKVPGYIDYPGNGLHPLAISIDGLEKDIEYGKTHTDEYSAAFFETKLCPRGKDIYTLRVGESERNSRTYG